MLNYINAILIYIHTRPMLEIVCENLDAVIARMFPLDIIIVRLLYFILN